MSDLEADRQAAPAGAKRSVSALLSMLRPFDTTSSRPTPEPPGITDSIIAVLMYHAVRDERGGCAGAEAHYAVTARQFDSHLTLSAQAGLQVRSVAHLRATPADRARSVAFTFDDGHGSNGWAAERIARVGGSADFFVNTSRVGKPHNLGWSDLRSMADAGMSIQSHGLEHRYLDELSPAEILAQLADSKRAIEDNLGRPVTLFAPPGGRAPAGLSVIAKRVGYAAVCSSRVGLWDTRQDNWDVPRLAVLRSTSSAQFARWISHDWWEITNGRARYLALAWAKWLLGNDRYGRLRGRLLRSGA